MAIDITKTYTELKNTILENRNVNTTPRSAVEDLFLLPCATQIAKIEILMQYINALQSFDSCGELLNSTTQLQKIADALNTDVDTVISYISESIEKLASNYGKTRKQATAATGIVNFWRPDAVGDDEQDSIIPKGTVVASASTGIQYQTTQDVYFRDYYYDYNFGTNGYMLDVPVKASVTGSVGNTVIGDITICISTVTGFPNVTNKNEISNGTDTETNANFIARMKLEISGTNIGTVNGIKSIVLQNFPAATSVEVISAGDDLMAPSRSDGGCFDVYVKGSTLSQAQIEFNNSLVPITSLDLTNNMPRPIVAGTASIVDEAVNVTAISDTTSIYAGSQKAFDKVIFSQPLTVGSHTLQYTYNSLITDVANFLAQKEYNTGANILVKEAQSVPIDIFLQVVSNVSTTASAADIKTSIVNNLITKIKSYISALQIGESLEQSDIINLCYIDGVNRVVLPLTYFKKTSDTTKDVYDVIEVNKMQYITLGNLSITI